MYRNGEARKRIRATVEVEITAFAEFSSEGELAELLTRCMEKGENLTSHGLKPAIVDYLQGITDRRIGYTEDGNKDAYLADDLEATVIKVEILEDA